MPQFSPSGLSSPAVLTSPNHHQTQPHQQPHYSNRTHTNPKTPTQPVYEPRQSFTAQQQRLYSVIDLVEEVHYEEKKRHLAQQNLSNSIRMQSLQRYYAAASVLNKQLSGKSPISLAEAYYAVEYAYGNVYLSLEEFQAEIQQSANFMLQWLEENHYDSNDPQAKHFAIQQFMSKKLSVSSLKGSEVKGTITHIPFKYDYEDFKGAKDYRNFFVSKCIATGSGQCNSLPVVYNLFAEALEVPSYLSFAPHHAFVKYPSGKGFMHGFEPTSGTHVTDRWFQDRLFIDINAKRSGIYLDTLNRQQMVANCLVDLASGFMVKFGGARPNFVLDCIDSSLAHFPKKNNIHAYFMRSTALAYELDRLGYKYGIKGVHDIKNYPEAYNIYQALVRNETLIANLGHQELPDGLYQQIMTFQENKRIEQDADTKSKKSLFIESF